MQGQIVLDHTFTGPGENAHKYKMQIRTNTFCKWPQILKLSCYVFAVPQMPSCSHFNATLTKSFVTKPHRAMNMFIHSCFKNTVIHSSRASRKTEYLIVVCSARISLRYSVSMRIQKRRFFKDFLLLSQNWLQMKATLSALFSENVALYKGKKPFTYANSSKASKTSPHGHHITS